MTNLDDPYRFAFDDDSISNTPRTRSSNRQRQIITTNQQENNSKKKSTNRCLENVSKPAPQRIPTRSSQKTPLTSINDEQEENQRSFMSNGNNSGFSQFINPKKRPREEKKTTKSKRSRGETHADENQPPNNDIDNEIQAIEQVKLAYETTGGRTNLARAVATNAKILATRNLTSKDTTYTVHNVDHQIIEDTQTDTLAIPDTLVQNDSQHNDSSWQKDIDRLMKKLEEPSSTGKTQRPVEITQIEETQIEEETPTHPEAMASILLTGTATANQQPPINSTILPSSHRTQSIGKQPTKDPTVEIAIQTDSSQPSSSPHACCQDVSTCPCVLRYSKLERLFMEKMARFISIVPTTPNSAPPVTTTEVPYRSRPVQSYSRWRRPRLRRRIQPRPIILTEPGNPPQPQPQPEAIEEIRAEEIVTENEEIEETKIEEINETTRNDEEMPSTTITKENTIETIGELSSIEKVETTMDNDHPSTLLLSTANETSQNDSIGKRLVLTSSSLDENQKCQFRSFVTHFGVSTTSTVDSSTTHVIVNESSSLVCPLTGKVIQGIARHLFIISPRWLNECLSEGTILDERPFEFRGDTSLGCDHGGMRRSRLTPSYLLENYSICLRCLSSDCAPLQNVEQVQELIECCGGKVFHHFSQIQTIEKQREIILVLGLNGFTGSEKKRQALLDTCQQFNVKCVNIHWLLISIAKFEIQSFESYDINQI